MLRYTFVLVMFVSSVVCAQTTWVVDDDGPADFATIQEAIDTSTDGDEIRVRPGVYAEKVNFRGRAVLVTGTDPEDADVVAQTVIAPGGDYGVTFDFGETGASLLKGVTIRGGGIKCQAASPTIAQCVIEDCPSAGITGSDSARPSILNCTIRRCQGRGISDCDGAIIGNSITYSGGGLFECDGPITDNIISHNYNASPGYGGGLYACDGTIAGNVISDNGSGQNGGALYRCNGDIIRNVIVGNRTQWQGGGLWNCGGTIRGNIIEGNRSYYGAGLHSCDGAIRNNTIVGNRAETGAGLRFCLGVVKNNIIAFNEASEFGGIQGVTNSSYNTYWDNAGGNLGGGATTGAGDIQRDPLLAVVGQWDPNGTADPNDDFWVSGDYHLQSQSGRWDPNEQIWVQDAASSPSIDGGDPAEDWTGEFWQHGARINMGAYGGTNQASLSRSTVGDVADLNLDDLVDARDLKRLTQVWLLEGLLRPDCNRDGAVDFADVAILTAHWRTEPPAPTAPTPDPMTWAVEPNATSESKITMEATEGISTDGSSVEYYFEDFHNPTFNSGWIAETTWTDTGLPANGEFCYRVKARNTGNLLETEWSELGCATTLPAVPPSPDPTVWETPPAAVTAGSITMSAKSATSGDGTVVEYFFENTTVAGHDSGWQSSATYTDTGLAGNTQYSYRVKARNQGNQAETAYSDVRSATTPDPDTTAPTPNPMRWATGGEPAKVQKAPFGSFDWHAVMTAEEASDDNGVEYRFVCSDNRFSSSWQDSREYSVHIGQKAYYVTFYVVARDKSSNHNQTAPSSTLPWQ